MSNLCDVVGLTIPYGKTNAQYETEFEPATATAWGYFNPKGVACYSLGLLKDMRAHDERQAARVRQLVIEAAASGEVLFVPAIVLCELIWVLSRRYARFAPLWI